MTIWQYIVSTHADGLLGYLAIILTISVFNLFWFRRIEHYPPASQKPLVSILIPARNEEGNIGGCVSSVLGQDYPHLEILILDDQSTDRTAEIVRRYRQQDDRVVLIEGKPLPTGWLGKHWACQQLAEQSRGELLLFLDADTRLHPQAITHAVNTFFHERVQLLSVVPREIVKTWGERLIQPFFLWAVYTVLPLGIARKVQLDWLTFTIGQFMLFDRRVYFEIGGHAAIRNDAVDDLAMGRRIVKKGFRWWLADGSDQVECRMYHSLSQVINGFSKNYFAAFRYNLLTYSFVFTWLMVVFWEPLVVLFFSLSGIKVNYFPIEKAGLATGLSLLIWGLVYARLKFPVYLAFFYPLTVLFNTLIAIRSFYLTLRGTSTWKGRRLEKPKIRFF
ncbi:MAG: glycosyltransferase [Chloroflexota bacterium]|nr:MAG: glycosyl hydrolase [Bellilinea sp.]